MMVRAAGGWRGGGLGGGSSQFHHRLPWGVVVDEDGAAQLLVVVRHLQVLRGLLTPEAGVIGFPVGEQDVDTGELPPGALTSTRPQPRFFPAHGVTVMEACLSGGFRVLVEMTLGRLRWLTFRVHLAGPQHLDCGQM